MFSQRLEQIKIIVVDDLLVAYGQPAPLILPVYVVNGVKAITSNAN